MRQIFTLTILSLSLFLAPNYASSADSAHAANDSHGTDEYRGHPVFNENEEPKFQLAEPDDQKVINEVVDNFVKYQEEDHGMSFAKVTVEQI